MSEPNEPEEQSWELGWDGHALAQRRFRRGLTSGRVATRAGDTRANELRQELPCDLSSLPPRLSTWDPRHHANRTQGVE